ncbi:MAG TPA: phosphonatase-like hydrolase [Fimbriimonas sp.]|nr:phosphonatase-like hydrolase [Fimbriimonas sp.]
MIELVVMDVAGTTVEDPDGVGGCLKVALTAHDVPWEHDAVNAIMGIPKPVAIRELLKQFKTNGDEPSTEEVQSIFLDFRKRMIAYYEETPDIREIPGASAAFKEMRSKGIKIALDTGFDRAVLDAVLRRVGWENDVLDTTVASDEVSRGRPFPDLVFLAMERTGVADVKKVAKVGDTPSDLQEGTAAGCALVVGVCEGTHTAEQLARHPHTHLIPSIAQLPALLDEVKL